MFQSTASANGVKHGRKIVAPTFLDSFANTSRLLRRAMLHYVNQRQRRFSLGEVVADVLPRVGLLAGVIEYIVNQLESRAEVHPVGGQRLFDLRCGMTENGAQLGSRFKQFGCLVVNDLHVTRFIDIGVVAVHQLQHFTLGNDIRRIGQHTHDTHVVDRHHHLESTGIEKVADQHAGGITEHRVGRVATTPQGGFIHHIVMQERGRVDEFDDGGHFVVPHSLVAHGTRSKENQRRTHTLAAAANNVLGDLPDKHHVRVKTVTDDRIDGLHVGPDQGIKLFQCHGRLFSVEARNLRGVRWVSQGRKIKDVLRFAGAFG